MSHTPNEEWAIQPEYDGHWYNAQKEYVFRALSGRIGRVLVIGSPIFEAKALQDIGWEVTYCDVRKPPVAFPREIIGDAATADFPAGQFEAVTSTCVLCHAGLGRYDDPKRENADKLIMRNIQRALRRFGRAVIMFGPVHKFPQTVADGSKHRIYNIRDAVALTEGFLIIKMSIFNTTSGEWCDHLNYLQSPNCDYISMVLEKQ